jgi:hypothetical protein
VRPHGGLVVALSAVWTMIQAQILTSAAAAIAWHASWHRYFVRFPDDRA